METFPNRSFLYHIEILSKTKCFFRKIINNNRKYRIHINTNSNCSTLDVLKSYYFARLLDKELCN